MAPPTPTSKKGQKGPLNSVKKSILKSTGKSSQVKTDKITDTQNKISEDVVIDDIVARKVLQEVGVSQQFVNSGKLLAWALSPLDESFKNIHDYIQQSQNHGFGIKVLTILRIISDVDILKEFSEDPNHNGKLRMALWHGTKTHLVASILENGLKIPRNNGQMFGNGVYFADRASKSAQYCGGGSGALMSIGSVGYMFLCDVLLGKVYNAKKAIPGITEPPKGFDSVKGLGVLVPDDKDNKDINGCVWPLGKTINSGVQGWNNPLNFNEYAVYSDLAVQPKYLVKIEFTNSPYYEKIA